MRADSILVVHISRERFERIRAQGYQLPAEHEKSIVKRLAGGDTLYHLLDADEAECPECYRVRTSVKVETPAELEATKYRLRYGPFPTITIDRAGLDLDLATLNYLNQQIELARALGDYICVNVEIKRLPTERYCGALAPTVKMPG